MQDDFDDDDFDDDDFDNCPDCGTELSEGYCSICAAWIEPTERG